MSTVSPLTPNGFVFLHRRSGARRWWRRRRWLRLRRRLGHVHRHGRWNGNGRWLQLRHERRRRHGRWLKLQHGRWRQQHVHVPLLILLHASLLNEALQPPLLYSSSSLASLLSLLPFLFLSSRPLVTHSLTEHHVATSFLHREGTSHFMSGE